MHCINTTKKLSENTGGTPYFAYYLILKKLYSFRLMKFRIFCKPHYLKTDFAKWRDEDDSDEDDFGEDHNFEDVSIGRHRPVRNMAAAN